MPTLQELQERVERLEDRSAIQQLKARYARLADERYGKSEPARAALSQEISELFAEDAVWDGGTVAYAQGRQQIRDVFVSPRHTFAIHYFKLIDLDVAGDRARASWIYFMPATKTDNTAVWQAGQEDEEYVKVDGVWLIKSLKMTLFFHTAFDGEGWGKSRVISY
jgi:hypothetical protein